MIGEKIFDGWVALVGTRKVRGIEDKAEGVVKRGADLLLPTASTGRRHPASFRDENGHLRPHFTGVEAVASELAQENVVPAPLMVQREPTRGTSGPLAPLVADLGPLSKAFLAEHVPAREYRKILGRGSETVAHKWLGELQTRCPADATGELQARTRQSWVPAGGAALEV